MPIDLVFSLNVGYLRGLLAVINSVISNSHHQERLRFHLITPRDERDLFREKMGHYFPAYPFTYREFIPNPGLAKYIQQRYSPPTETKKSAVNMLFARLFLKEICPDLTKVLHIDADMVVLQEIAELFDNIHFSPTQYFAAVPNAIPAILHFTNPFAVGKELLEFKQTFNAGVIFTDLQYWTDRDFQRIDAYLQLDAQHGYNLFQLNDETILNLLFKDYLPLDDKWNCSGYGNWQIVARLLRKELSQIGILHWSGGHHKPWSSPHIVYGEVWRKYAIL